MKTIGFPDLQSETTLTEHTGDLRDGKSRSDFFSVKPGIAMIKASSQV